MTDALLSGALFRLELFAPDRVQVDVELCEDDCTLHLNAYNKHGELRVFSMDLSQDNARAFDWSKWKDALNPTPTEGGA